jgi:phage terminase small subunit
MSAETPKNPVKRKPTVRQARFAEGLAEGKSARRAAREAGYSESSADHATAEILPVVERALGEVIRSAIPVERLVQRLDEGLDAVEVKVATFEGKITDQREFVDYGQRRAYVELIVKLGGQPVLTGRNEQSTEDVRAELIRKLSGVTGD